MDENHRPSRRSEYTNRTPPNDSTAIMFITGVLTDVQIEQVRREVAKTIERLTGQSCVSRSQSYHSNYGHPVIYIP